MTTTALRGREHLAALCEAFPTIPRSIVIKTDILREGTRYTRDLEAAGTETFPHSLIWNPHHRWNPHEAPEPGALVTIPWKFDLPDGTPVVVRFARESPWEIRRANGGWSLQRDGEEIETVGFEPRTDWLFASTSAGALMASVFLSWTRESLLGCALRYCEYTKSGDQCVYCCLDANMKEYRQQGIPYDLAVKPENAAEAYRAALGEVGRIREVAFTGGSLLDSGKETARYAALFDALRRVRDEERADSELIACLTPPPGRDALRRLQDAGLQFIGPNMDCWEERLWPVIVPGKHKFVGRQAWIDTLGDCVDVLGKGHVYTVFVVGPEMTAPHGFAAPAEGVASWRRCFEWALSHDVVPHTSQWEVEVGSPWQAETPPPAEYFLEIGLLRHELMRAHGGYDWMRHHYYKSGAWSTDADYRRLMTDCRCENCA